MSYRVHIFYLWRLKYKMSKLVHISISKAEREISTEFKLSFLRYWETTFFCVFFYMFKRACEGIKGQNRLRDCYV